MDYVNRKLKSASLCTLTPTKMSMDRKKLCFFRVLQRVSKVDVAPDAVRPRPAETTELVKSRATPRRSGSTAPVPRSSRGDFVKTKRYSYLAFYH